MEIRLRLPTLRQAEGPLARKRVPERQRGERLSPLVLEPLRTRLPLDSRNLSCPWACPQWVARR